MAKKKVQAQEQVAPGIDGPPKEIPAGEKTLSNGDDVRFKVGDLTFHGKIMGSSEKDGKTIYSIQAANGSTHSGVLATDITPVERNY